MAEKNQLNQRVVQVNLANKKLEITNKETILENRLLKEAMNKLQQSIVFGQENRKNNQNSQQNKDY